MRAVIINRPVESGKFMGKGYDGAKGRGNSKSGALQSGRERAKLTKPSSAALKGRIEEALIKTIDRA